MQHVLSARHSSCLQRSCSTAPRWRAGVARTVRAWSTGDSQQPSTATAEETTSAASTSSASAVDLEKDITKGARQIASTFAPRSSTATKNPAFKGSLLYDIFEWQAWICLALGGLLSFNILWPTDEPSIPRLLGMWSIWMFTIPSLRAKECQPKEKDALNLLFVAIPLMNVLLPFVWKSFPFIFTMDTITVLGVYYWKGVWKEVYGLPLEPPSSAAAAPSTPTDGGSSQ